MIKNNCKTRYRRYLKLIKDICGKTNTIFNGERHYAKIRNNISMSILATSINIELGVLARAIRQENEVKGNQTGKEQLKLPPFSDNISCT